MTRFYIPLNESKFELTVKKSIFYAFLYPFSNEEELLRFLKSDRQRYRDATHYVYAFRLGQATNYKEGYTDDGEPSGTAGKPILSLLQRKAYFNVLVVVVRYYGGIPLGVGGLVRAYTQVSEEVVKKTTWEVYVKKINIKLIFPYEYYNLIKRELSFLKAHVKEEEFGDKIFLYIELAKEKKVDLYQRLIDLSAGSCQRMGDEVYELFKSK